MKLRFSERKGSTVEFVKNLGVFIARRTISFGDYINMECKEIFGDDNKWWAGENLKHSPTDMDCHKNYISHEADKLFRKKYHYLVERPWQRKIKDFFCSLKDTFASLAKQTNRKKWASG